MSKFKKIATLGFGSGINILVNFLFLPYMARVLNYNDYGSYGQTLLIVTFANSLLSFGLSQIIYVYLNKEESTNNVVSSNVFAAFSLGIIGFAFVALSGSFFASWLNNPSLESLLFIFAFSLPLSLPYLSINSFLIFKNRVKLSASLAVTTNIIKVVLVVTAIQLYGSISLALLGILTSQLIQLILGLFFTRKQLVMKIDKRLFFTQLKKGFPLGLTGVLGAGILYIDGIMVSKIEGIEAYAIYRNGAIEVPFISTIYTSIAAIILPEVSKLFNRKKFKEIIELKKKVIMNTMMLTYPVLVFLLFNANDLIIIYLGEKYETSAIIFAIFNLTLLIRVNDYHDILVAANKPKYILYFYTIVFILNLFLNYFFIRLFGSVGAAYSTVISLLVFSFLHLFKSASTVNGSIKDFFDLKKLALLLFISISTAIILNLSISYFFNNEARLILFTTLFFPTVYLMLIKFNLISKGIISHLIPKKFRT
jgi:O-antigen/teichoic acid export membrane protein